MWQDTPSVIEVELSWTESLDMCENLEHAGFSDWRLPNINELKRAVFFRSRFKYDFDLFNYWSSTPNILNPENKAWSAFTQSATPQWPQSDKNLARCVRNDTSSAASPYVFDSSGKHIKTIDITSGKTLTTFLYDEQGRLISLKDRFDNTISISRNAQGIATQITSPDGFVTKLTVDENHDLIRAEYDDGSAYTFAYINSLMTEESDPNGNQFDKVYSSIGRIEQTQDPEGGQWNFFNLENTLTNVTSYGYTTAENSRYESASSLLLNGDNKLVTTYADNSQRERITQADGLKESLRVSDTYSVIDKIIDEKTKQPIPHVITTTMPSGLKSVTQIDKTYGDNGTDTSKITVTVNSNNKVNTVFKDITTGEQINTTAGNRTISYMTDPQTQLLTSAQVSGLTASENQYDAKGRLISSSMGERVTRYTYDDVNSKGALTAITDAEGYSTYFEYDIMGRLIKTIYPDGGVLEQSYDFNGNMLSLTPPGQPEHRFNYNSVDNATAYTPPVVTTVDGQNEAEAVSTPATTYDYDKDRKLAQVTRPDGQIVTVNYTKGTDQVSSMDIPRGTYSYSYDQHGKLIEVIAPDNSKVSYEYDGNLPISETLTGAVSASIGQTFNNDFNVIQQCINEANCIDYQYDNDGLVTVAGDLTVSHEAQKGGIVNSTELINIISNFNHNTFGERATETFEFNNSQLFSVNYTRDKLGRITTQSQNFEGKVTDQSYTFNEAGRLTKVIKDGITTTYTFDSNGNRLSKVSPSSTELGVYDEQDRLVSYGNCRYQYSKNGELSQKTCGTDITLYDYDVIGNLLKVTLPEVGGQSDVIEYLIDGQNRRIGKKLNGVLQQGLLYGDQLSPIAELDSNSNVIAQFVYVTKVNVPDYMIKNGKTYQFITDHVGSPVMLVDAATGEVAQQMRYDEFGNILSDSNPGFQPFGFAGGIYEQATGLTRFGARDYDAHIGRWASKDPIRFAGGDSNLYGYVLGDPVNFIDPTGLFITPQTIGGTIGLFGGFLYSYYVNGNDFGTALMDGVQAGSAGFISGGGSLLLGFSASAGASAIRTKLDSGSVDISAAAINGVFAVVGGNIGKAAGSFIPKQMVRVERGFWGRIGEKIGLLDPKMIDKNSTLRAQVATAVGAITETGISGAYAGCSN